MWQSRVMISTLQKQVIDTVIDKQALRKNARPPKIAMDNRMLPRWHRMSRCSARLPGTGNMATQPDREAEREGGREGGERAG
mmetsp:Transcript_14296/g.40639  ORF Transcript_14296/g.40639 Transcript_14296/m.40639 type:complete len:82 (-) Transcript_14296:60-305(-)